MADEMLIFNGVNGITGHYDLPPMPVQQLAESISKIKPPRNLPELRFRYQQRAQKYLGVSVGLNASSLSGVGWGLIMAQDADPTVLDALAPLLDLRQKQTGEYFRIYTGADGYQPGDTKQSFLKRHGVTVGIVEPNQMPFYLLLVGSPDEIPYQFQNEMDVGYAIGRLHFDTLDDYAAYAESVVASETGSMPEVPRRAALFAPRHDNDQWTQLSGELLVEPLLKRIASSRSEWEFDVLFGDEATKANLTRLLGGDRKPALLFTAAHGLVFPADDPRHTHTHGALLCQDWPGLDTISPDHYFAAADFADDADLRGQVLFCFGSYSAGTPRDDDSSSVAGVDAPVAPQAAVAALARRALCNPRGAALAVIGQMERAWSYAFPWLGAGAQTTVFEGTLVRLLSGDPVGFAAEHFDERYAEMASDLTDMLEQVGFGVSIDPYELVGMWTAGNDMRSHIVFGDPAVRLFGMRL